MQHELRCKNTFTGAAEKKKKRRPKNTCTLIFLSILEFEEVVKERLDAERRQSFIAPHKRRADVERVFQVAAARATDKRAGADVGSERARASSSAATQARCDGLAYLGP